MRPDESKPAAAGSNDQDEHIGAVEGDRPTDTPNQGNPQGTGIDAQGCPDDPVATAQDRIGANLDESEGG